MKRILAVDDDHAILQLEERFLTAEGYDVVKAGDGLAAMQAFDREAIDLVLLDIMMPGIDGFEVKQLIGKAAGPRKVPVIFITARQDPEALAQSFKVGGTVFLTKPFSRKQLIQAVGAILR